jgi:hypothetical protein
MPNFINRVYGRLSRELAQAGVSPRFQPFHYFETESSQSRHSILIIAAGSVHIPTHGWGAVETIIAETIPVYLQHGFNVGLLNSQNLFEWKKAKKFSYSLIICHSDEHLLKARKAWPQTPLIAVTHYGLAGRPELWHKSYRKVFSAISTADRVVCLSPAVYESFSRLIPKEKLVQIGNGTSFQATPIADKSDALVMVGKVEERKRQYELWQYALANNLKIHFLGPIEDSRVLEHLNQSPKLKEYFKGPKNREELAQELPQYRALVLLSAGEADALVLYEAQIAGLEIITNRDSLGNQEPELPWIHLIRDEHELKDAVKRITSNPVDPIEIATHARTNYKWETKLVKIIDLVKEFS